MREFDHPPGLDEMQAIARQALESIPERLARHVQGVVIQVEDFPDPEVERAMDLESPFDILGLYQGISIGEKSVGLTPSDVDRIFLYRRPILDYWCETGERLDDIVRHVLIHEIGHHFGFSDDDMERLEDETADP